MIIHNVAAEQGQHTLKPSVTQPWHLLAVDVFTVRDGKVAAKLAYVKG